MEEIERRHAAHWPGYIGDALFDGHTALLRRCGGPRNNPGVTDREISRGVTDREI